MSRLLCIQVISVIGILGLVAFEVRTQNPQSLKVTPGSWKVTITQRNPLLVSIYAEDARADGLTQALAKQSGISIRLSSMLKQHRITCSIENSPIEEALRAFAPQGYFDMLVSTDPSVAAKPVAIFLQGYNEPQPRLELLGNNSIGVFVLEGEISAVSEQTNTELKAKSSLFVKYANGVLSIKARHQMLTNVLSHVADQMNIPFVVDRDCDDIVDVEIVETPPVEALKALSPNLLFYQRYDIQNRDRMPMRLQLAPAKLNRSAQ